MGIFLMKIFVFVVKMSTLWQEFPAFIPQNGCTGNLWIFLQVGYLFRRSALVVRIIYQDRVNWVLDQSKSTVKTHVNIYDLTVVFSDHFIRVGSILSLDMQ